jgi:hypothetical protein
VNSSGRHEPPLPDNEGDNGARNNQAAEPAADERNLERRGLGRIS